MQCSRPLQTTLPHLVPTVTSMNRLGRYLPLVLAGYVLLVPSFSGADPLPNTGPLEMQGDLADAMVAGIDRFLLGKIDASVAARARHWKRDKSSADNYNASVAPNRARFAKIIGAHDERAKPTAIELLATTTQGTLVGRGENFEAFAARWPAVRGVAGEGLLLVPKSGAAIADVVAIPDADQSPEQLAGLVPGVEPQAQFAHRLAESGCRVLVPALIDRADTYSASPSRATNQPHREFLYRPAYEMGRHIVGYEVQKVFAAVDFFAHDAGNDARPIGVAGYGEGGLLALYSAALDTRIDAALVSGYFDSRQNVWQEPIYRNVFGLLDQFGDAELAGLVAPRALVVEACGFPQVAGPPPVGNGRHGSAAPGRLSTPTADVVRGELDRARKPVDGLAMPHPFELVLSAEGSGPPGSAAALEKFLAALSKDAQLAPLSAPPTALAKQFDSEARQKRLFDQINADTQHLMRESEYVRDAFWSKADRNARDVAKWQATTQDYRKHFYDDVIGRFDQERLPPRPRSRQIYDETLYTGHEVVLDVFPDVFAYGILLLPKDIAPGERRPVVVCQHGLEGRPTDVADPRKVNKSYNQYACRLAERGFIVYAPQNPYIFTDRFRTLQRKANPLAKTLFSVIVPQHQQLVDWLATLPQVDPDRIAFYGLSYGGKTAMRVPAIVERYCLSICSADFDEWIWKNVSTRAPYSYVTTGEYEMFEFDLGNTYNYAEMAALIAPRPFMVERGHHDGVAPDPWVAYEYAKVRLLYAALQIPERTAIEFFDGPHTIHGVGTFEFLHRHLDWPEKLNR
jgi:dienelactone hydrolase